MAAKTVKLTAPNGASVSVSSDRVDNLLRRGFAEAAETPKKTTAKKASSSKTSK